ncbi:MAG TPA: hypothetical protein DFH97_01360 [Clostridiales bacterium]|nr:hypothetical protein [Clostridiales bacterium]HCI63694.1 hypothetical protein [Clostridiales bacterium]
MEENKETLELLQKIEKSNRIQVYSGYVRTGLVLICTVCILVLTARIMKLMPQVNGILGQAEQAMGQIQTVLGNLESTTTQLAKVDLAGMVDNVDSLVVTGQQSLEESMGKLNGVDFDALNQAIKDLADVIEPLAKMTRVLR